jgi:hypothetical protein
MMIASGMGWLRSVEHDLLDARQSMPYALRFLPIESVIGPHNDYKGARHCFE